MAIATLNNISVVLKLNNGTTASGGIKTVNLKLGGSSQAINMTAYNADLSSSRAKALALAGAIEDCLIKSVYMITETTDNEISN